MTKITIIGGGLAGLQAGIITAKANEDTLILDTDESLVHNTSNIQNLIGHESIAGQELLKSGKEKLENFNGELKEQKVEKIEKTEEKFQIQTEETTIETEYIIIASAGVHDYLEELNLEYEDGVEGPYMMDKHIKTDDTNEAQEKIYAAGLANSWEYQTSTAIGDGAKAAVNLLTEIKGEPYTDHDT
jgi:thioredoxin reductase